jgi:hypothetical protein
MPTPLQQVDGLLRGRFASHSTASAWALLTLGGVAYGLVMGSYGLETEFRPWQMVYSAVKTPLLLLVTFALSLPSFFVLNSLFGLREDFGRVLNALASSQAVVTLVLASLAPYTAFWYLCSRGYSEAILLNGLMFAIASFSGQAALRRAFRPLIARNAWHRWLLWVWLVMYTFVGIQLGWVLRPFIGYPGTPVQFVREGGWDNAYVIVIQMLRGVCSRSYY